MEAALSGMELSDAVRTDAAGSDAVLLGMARTDAALADIVRSDVALSDVAWLSSARTDEALSNSALTDTALPDRVRTDMGLSDAVYSVDGRRGGWWAQGLLGEAGRGMRSRRGGPLVGLPLLAAPLLLALTWPLAQPLRAAPAAAFPPDVFPPSSVFRTLQLNTLACGRENTAERCGEARRQADPLLDHPRLPARCKDVLWSIRNLAVEAPTNSLTRRDPIDQAAAEVTIACRPVLKVKPQSKPQGTAPAGGDGQLRFGGGQP